jgi:hypothetical protein
MQPKKRFIFVLVLAALVLALPMTVLANKQLYQARLTTDAELHVVIGSNARGAFNMGTNPDGTMQFILQVRNLSGPATGAHLHAPATTSENAGVVLTLCGGPPPSVTGPCVTDDDGYMLVQGTALGHHLQGIGGGAFFNALNNGLVYVNVHTALNPAGEVRGQLERR